MNKKELFILEEVLNCIRKARLLFSDSRRDKDITISFKLALDADNKLVKAIDGLQSILEDN